MKTEKVHTLILGAGPAGLAASYVLARAGAGPVLLERDKVCGGLMRSIRRGDFIVDVGRKELYNRLAKVDNFWQALLGDQFRLYDHRGGVLFDGCIIDREAVYQGFRRGLPWGMFLSCCWDFAKAQISVAKTQPKNVQEYFYRSRGARLTQIFSQGFQEKLTGQKWEEMPILPEHLNGHRKSVLSTTKAALARTFVEKNVNTFKGVWRHPARGTGQICESLERGARENGGTVHNQVKILDMTASGGRIATVIAEVGGEVVTFEPQNVVSSIPLEHLVPMLLKKKLDAMATDMKASPFRKKTVVLVYLFLNEKPRFPQAWLDVTCPKTRVGRITNYAALNGEMVPPGKSSFCVEYYCFDDDPLLNQTDQQFSEMALTECSGFNLLDRTTCFDSMVLRFPGADASQNRHNWLSRIRLGLLEELKPIKNLYYVNRTDLDIATLAGIESAEAILSGNRADFDTHVDPTRIGIRSEKKDFEFKNPAAQL